MKTTLICLTLTAALFAPSLSEAADSRVPPKPNIILILADDQGWNALSTPADPDNPSSGSTYYQTPSLAKLAKEGMRFSQAYSPAPTCSPTRWAIQFGRSPASLGIWGADGIGKSPERPPAETLARQLKKLRPEYRCAHLGKWHIAYDINELGYDEGTAGGNRTGNSKDPDDPKLIFSLSKQANAFIEKQVKAKQPFFLQISHYADHLAYQALAATKKKYETERADKKTKYQKDPLWAAMNENLDTGVGMVLDKIDELGIADNTYVIYTADNGYESKRDFGKPVHQRGYYKAFPQRSHKYHVSEGGIRVPFIVRGPGVPANTHSSLPVVGTDIFPTILDILGGGDQLPEKVEGGSLLAHLQSGGKEPIQRKDPFLVFKYSKPRVPHDITIVQGDYKLIKDIDTGKIFLFNLKKDIGESNDLSAEQPERTKQMYSDLTAYFKRFGWDESMITGKRKKR